MTAYIHPYLFLATAAQHLTIQSDNARTHNATRIRLRNEESSAPSPKQSNNSPPTSPRRKKRHTIQQKQPPARQSTPPFIPRSSQTNKFRMSPQLHEQSCGMLMEEPAQPSYFVPPHSLTSNATKPERKRSSETIPFDDQDMAQMIKGRDTQLCLIKPERKVSLEELPPPPRDEKSLLSSPSSSSSASSLTLHMAHVAARAAARG